MREEEIRACFRFLDQHDFQLTGRLPLVASRCWHFTREYSAWGRFRRGSSNIHEVGFPKLYCRSQPSYVRRLFRCLTLGHPDEGLAQEPLLRPLFEGQQDPRPRWTVVARFGRYILRSNPGLESSDFVYLGDDTLHLMDVTRTLLAERQEERVSLLDLCCGSGGISLTLPDFPGRVVGIDLNHRAVELARLAAAAQGLKNYHYRIRSATEPLNEKFHLVVGNPPTLNPALTGRDVFHATGDEKLFREVLQAVFGALLPEGEAYLTVFSTGRGLEDSSYKVLQEIVPLERSLRYKVRREFPLEGDAVLRHCGCRIGPEGHTERIFQPLAKRGWTLPFLSARQP